MVPLRRLPGLLVFILVVGFGLASTVTLRADWPQWRGPNRDGHTALGDTLPRKLSAEPRILWRQPAGPGLASPLVVGDRVLVFDAQNGQETLRALEATTGAERWRQTVDVPVSDSQGPTGPRCTPVAQSNRVYAVSCRGELQCRSIEDGNLLWHANYSSNFGAVFIGEKGAAVGASRHGNNSTPLVDGDQVIACAGSTNEASVIALDAATGAVRWRSQNDVAGYAAPVVGTPGGIRQYVCFTAEAAIGLECKTGRLLWRHPFKTAFGRHAATPVIDGDRVIVSTHQAGVVALEIRRQGDLQSATPVWTNREAAMNFSSPVQAGGILFGLGASRNVVAVEAATGSLRWNQDGWYTTPQDKAHGGFITDAATLLMLTDGGELGLFDLQDPAGKSLGRAQVCGANWCNPAWSNGRLILRDAKSWICLDLGH